MKIIFPLFLILIVGLSQVLYAQSHPTVLITYYSQSGKTQAMAEAVAKGVESVSGVDYILKPLDQVTEGEILKASAIILGSPVYNANMAPEVQTFINSWPFEERPLKDKIGAVFVTGGGFSIGEEAVMFSMIRAMMIHGMVIVGGEEVEAAFGASAITGEGDFADKEVQGLFLKKAEGLGRRVGEIVLKRK